MLKIRVGITDETSNDLRILNSCNLMDVYCENGLNEFVENLMEYINL